MVDPSVYPFYQRLQQNPDDAEALFLVWQWHGDRGEFQQLATLAEQVAARRTDPVSAADLYYRAGELWAKNLNRHDKAVGDYRRAYELDPNQAGAIDAARGIYIELGNFKLAVQLLERQLGAIGEPAQRLALLRELATVRAHTNEPSGQAAALEEVLKLVPGDFESMRELAGAYLARAETPDGGEADRMRASALLATIAHGLDNDQTVSFAESALDAWGGEEHAFAIVSEAYVQAGESMRKIWRCGRSRFSPPTQTGQLAVDADSQGACRALLQQQPIRRRDCRSCSTGSGGPRRHACVDRLVPSAQTRGADLVSAARIASRIDRPGDAAHRRPARDRRAVRAAAERSRRHACRVARDPHVRPGRRRRRWLSWKTTCARAMQFAELRQVLLGRAPTARTSTADARKARLREAALLSDQRLKDADGARAAWELILRDHPSDPEALVAVDKLLQRAERWDQLARFLELRSEAVEDDKERCTLLERLADLHRDKRNDSAAEAEALGTLWALEPDDDRISTRLLDARRRLEAMYPASAKCCARAPNTPPAEQATERWAMLASHLEQANDRDGALDAWQRVYHPGSRRTWPRGRPSSAFLERTGSTGHS